VVGLSLLRDGSLVGWSSNACGSAWG